MDIFSFLNNHYSIKKIIDADKLKISATNDEFNMMLIATDFYSANKSVFVVLPNLYLAQKYYDGISSFVNEEDVLFFPADELVSASIIAATGYFLFERIQTIVTLLTNEKKIIITHLHGAVKYELPRYVWENNIFTVKTGMEIETKECINKLVRMGYEPVYTVTKTGEFAHRGSIIDIFPLGCEQPIRLDFFGDEIETIKSFNPESQRSIEKVESMVVLPVSEFIYDNEEFQLAKNRIYGFLDNFKLSEIETDMLNKDFKNPQISCHYRFG